MPGRPKTWTLDNPFEETKKLNIKSTASAIKKATPQKNVRFFRDFSWWFKMLPSLFELLNHLHKRPFQLVKGIIRATRTHRPLSKDLNLLRQKNIFFWGGGGRLPTKTTGKVPKRFPLRKSMA
jgi:hypothetical protein